MSICDQPNTIIDSKKSVYVLEDNLEDETLRLIMNPQDHINQENEQLNSNLDTEKDNNLGYRQLLNKKHPNALAFDDNGKLYVGDSNGEINVWQIMIEHSGTVRVNND